MLVDKFECHHGSMKFKNWRTNRLKTSNLGGEQDRHFTYNVTLRRVRVNYRGKAMSTSPTYLDVCL